jgi:hypothetical protein
LTLRAVTPVAFCLLWPAFAGAATYHVDCTRGSDEAKGTSEAAAWKTLARLNATEFVPGDRILLRAGCEWSGTLRPKGSGAPGHPITLDRYGDGPKPLLRGEGALATVVLRDQEFWEIGNLRVTNDAPSPGLRRGVLILAEETTDVLRHIYLRGLEVSDVAGQLGADMLSKSTGGIGFEARGKENAARFDDIRVEDSSIEHVDGVGIYLWSEPMPHPRHARWAELHHTNVAVRRNRLSDIGKNAIIVRASAAPIIEHNVVAGAAARLHGNAIFVFGCRDAVMQFNEVFDTRYDGMEGAAFDSDYNSEGTIVQYNYSHDNGGGLVNLCNNPPHGYNDATIVRYNVSRNEKDRVIGFDGPVTNTQIYNNTIDIGPGRKPRIVEFDLFGSAPGYADHAVFLNNVIHNGGEGVYVWGGATNLRFEGNCFSGAHPDSEPRDPRKIIEDPRFVAPETVGAGLASIAGYSLTPGSPCARSGLAVTGSGGRDVLGATLPLEGLDRGAVQTPTGPRRPESTRPTTDKTQEKP